MQVTADAPGHLTISIKQPQQLLVLGRAQDFALCKVWWLLCACSAVSVCWWVPSLRHSGAGQEL